MSRFEHLGRNGAAGYFITFSCYGSRLHGDERSTVRRDRNGVGTPLLGWDERLEEAERAQMKQEPFVLDARRRACVADSVARTAEVRGWAMHVMNVRTQHAHVVVSAPEVRPERVMNDFKAWATRALRESGLAGSEERVWSRHGSTIYLWRDEDVGDACWYVRERQGEWIAGCGAPRPEGDEGAGSGQPLAGARGTEIGREPGVGLCVMCRWGRRVVSGRGSVFWMCERSDGRAVRNIRGCRWWRAWGSSGRREEGGRSSEASAPLLTVAVPDRRAATGRRGGRGRGPGHGLRR
jgi:hypothetical protein